MSCAQCDALERRVTTLEQRFDAVVMGLAKQVANPLSSHVPEMGPWGLKTYPPDATLNTDAHAEAMSKPVGG